MSSTRPQRTTARGRRPRRLVVLPPLIIALFAAVGVGVQWSGVGPGQSARAATVNADGITLSGAASAASVASGATVTLSATVVSTTARTAVVDLEVYDAAGARVLQKAWDAQSLAAASTTTLSTTWTPTATGTYTLKLGVFTAGWASLVVWHDGAATVKVTAATAATTSAATSAATATTAATSAAATTSAASTTTSAAATTAASTSGYQVEKLDRGLISVHSSAGNLVSWRLLATDPAGTTFDVYRGSTKLTSTPLTSVTTYLDAGAAATASYTVRPIVGGVAQTASATSLTFGSGYLDVPLSKPAGGTTPDGVAYTYSAGDASTGDLDGDGQLEIVLKWDPSNAKDNSQSGYTGDVYLDALKLDGTRLWRLDLGRNIRAGAHYTQFQVYDYDGDGRAEVALKTADGTVDGTGAVIGSKTADYRTSKGYVLSGPEYLTMFQGTTGRALATVDFTPARGTVSSWGDSYGNRVDRFLASTAYLDGKRPSLIMSRGYYTRTVVTAWNFRAGAFSKVWTFDSKIAGSAYAGQGNHQMSVVDADQDGRDEIIFGAMAIDDDGSVLWNTAMGHGDALHVGDLIPSRTGLEVFKVDETSTKPSSWMADAKTGKILWSTAANGDNGRGVSDDIWAGSPGAESWSFDGSDQIRDTTGATVGRRPSTVNFLLWWDGDPVRELLDKTHVDKYGTSSDARLLTASGVTSINSTKAVPSLSGDLFGDWREEVVWPTTDSSALRIYSTPITTTRRLVTLLHDRTYREAIAWQNTGYNQPPHTSFFLGDGMSTPATPAVYTP